MLSKVCGDTTTVRSKVYEWHQRLKESREPIEYNGRPSTSQNSKNVALVSECVQKDHRQTLEQIALRLHSS
ncbi:hypothetical protein TNCV_4599171 [Trichonephila clavipes]|nr:hypothetical protein TNCV_4599171 [Trichonephila clavipes]